MTPRERVLRVLRGEPIDKVPFTIYESMIPHCSVERRLRNEGLCIVRGAAAHVAETPNCTTETYTYQEKGRPRVRTVIRTPVGEVCTVSEPAGFTSWTIERMFKAPEDYKALLYLAQDERYRPDYQEFARAERSAGEDVILRAGVGPCPLHHIMVHLMGLETFAIEWVENRDEILKLESAMKQKRRELYHILASAPITHANFGGNEMPDVMGAPRYKEFCIPLYNECAEAFHAKGKLLGTHLDGNNRPWAGAVAESALDYIEAFTPAPDTDMTLSEALDVWSEKVLWINFPSSMHLADIDRIKRTTRELVEAAHGKRLIIGITEDIPEDRWQQNLLAISEVINGRQRPGDWSSAI